jgi:hypothetical protein
MSTVEVIHFSASVLKIAQRSNHWLILFETTASGQFVLRELTSLIEALVPCETDGWPGDGLMSSRTAHTGNRCPSAD